MSKQREYLNNKIIPYLEKTYLTNGGNVLDIGKSTSWSYRAFFPKSNFLQSDTDEKLNPDFVDDICCSMFASEHWDMILFNGVFEQVKGDINDAFSELYWILKKDGILVCGMTGFSFPKYGDGHTDTGRRIATIEEALCFLRKFQILDFKAFYEGNALKYIYLICKKV